MSQPINMSQVPVKRRFGIRMDGCELPLESLIKQHLTLQAREQTTTPYTLIEVGSAGCVTLRAFKDIVTENISPSRQWRVIGLDLPPSKAWSLDMNEVTKAFDGKPVILGDYEVGILDRVENSMGLFLLEDPRSYLRSGAVPGKGIDFAFIDASHGKSCGLDFLALEHNVVPGGLVVFHDYGEPEQGTDWQDHDREFISVRSYVHRLGLASPSPKGVLRKGWRFVGEIRGTRYHGGDGNSCAVVQRTIDPLEVQPELSLD